MKNVCLSVVNQVCNVSASVCSGSKNESTTVVREKIFQIISCLHSVVQPGSLD